MLSTPSGVPWTSLGRHLGKRETPRRGHWAGRALLEELIAEEGVAATGRPHPRRRATSTAEAAPEKDDGGVQCLAAVPPAIPSTSMKTKRLNGAVKMMRMETVNIDYITDTPL